MVTSRSRFLIDTSFLIETTHRTFLGAPLLVVDGRDYTFAFGFLRDFLRLRRALCITKGLLVVGRDAHSATSRQNIEDVLAFVRRLRIPYVHLPRRGHLRIVSDLCPRFSHIVTRDRRSLQLSGAGPIILLSQPGGRQYDHMSSEAVSQNTGVDPADIPTYLALTEGVDGASLTSRQAIRLVELYGDLDAIYERLPTMPTSRVQRKLTGNEVQIRRYFSGSKIGRNRRPGRYGIKSVSLDLDTKGNREVLAAHSFHSLVPMLEDPVDGSRDPL